jgi:hypothetical protein
VQTSHLLSTHRNRAHSMPPTPSLYPNHHCLRQPVIMELFFLSSQRKRRSRTSPGTEQIKTWQFQPMPQRFRQIQAVLLSARLSEKLPPNLTLFHLLFTNESHQLIAMAVLSFELRGHVRLIKVRQPAMKQAPVAHLSYDVSLSSDSCFLSRFWTL